MRMAGGSGSEGQGSPRREILRGAADRVELSGIDRWLGGTHLNGEGAWRWDESAGELRHDAA